MNTYTSESPKCRKILLWLYNTDSDDSFNTIIVILPHCVNKLRIWDIIYQKIRF